MKLEDYTPTPLAALKERFSQARFDSSYLIKAGIETVEEVTKGKAALLDASSPAVMLMEMAAVQAATCVSENIALLNRQYPALAQTELDLYHHMSDEDYLDRFAQPAKESFIFALQLQDIIRNAVKDPGGDSYRLTIPRDTAIVVDGVSFMTLYPISVIRYASGAIQVSYEPEIASPLMPLSSTIIDYWARTGTEKETWIFFEVAALQLHLSSTVTMIDQTYSFKKTVQLIDHFHYATIYFRSNATNNAWLPMKTTHSDQVFDVETLTAVLQVRDGELDVSIPSIYTTRGMVQGEIRIDAYTTKGRISMNLKDYRNDNFKVAMRAVDEARDLSAATRAMANVSYYVYSQRQVEGGRAPVDFETLRERVITNTVGSQVIPITPTQLESELSKEGFDIVKVVDVLTNRIFLGTRALPTPSNERLVTAANVGILTYNAPLETFKSHYNVVDNGARITIRSNTVFVSENGQLTLLSRTDLEQLQGFTQTAMVAQINNRQYAYTPFYYVVDAARKEFGLKAYNLDQPSAENLNFLRQNQSLKLIVNTAAYQLTKVKEGYELRVQTKSGEFYKSVSDAEVGMHLGFQPNKESRLVYIRGVMESRLANGERIFRFDIRTNHDLDEDDQICITNARALGVDSYKAWINLEATFHLFHYTTSLAVGYAPDETDTIFGKFLAPAGAAGNTHETLKVTLGKALPSLWTRSRSYLVDTVYKLHEVDMPLYYEERIYETDELGRPFKIVNGEVQYTVLHEVGDPVLHNGEPVYKYRKGDIVYENGQPVVDETHTIGRELDLLMVDGRYFFATDPASVQYRQEIVSTLTRWIVEDIQTFQDRLLEKTKIFFYPKTTLGLVPVYTENGGEDYLTAEQTFKVSLYVSADVFRDAGIRASLTAATIRTLDSHMAGATINLNEVSESLRATYGRSVRAFNISGLGGSKNYQVLQVVSPRNKLSLKKELVIQPDKSTLVQDAVNIEFLMVS